MRKLTFPSSHVYGFCFLFLLLSGVLRAQVIAPLPGQSLQTEPNTTDNTEPCAAHLLLEEALQEDPNLRARMDQQEAELQTVIRELRDGTRNNNDVLTIPVVFHVVHNGDAIGQNENVSDALIQANLDQLNADFRRTNSDAGNTPAEFSGVDTKIEFCLATIDPQGMSTTGIIRHQQTAATFSKEELRNYGASIIWDRDSYMNVFIAAFTPSGGGSTLLGFANFPGTNNASRDANYLHYGTVGSIAQPNPLFGSTYGIGRVLTHEVGHWLNLRHIWGDGDCDADDYVADTPVQNGNTSGCATHPKVSCGTNDMFMNYMDYTQHDCMNALTAGQRDRMRATLIGGLRSSLFSSPGCGAVVNHDARLTFLGNDLYQNTVCGSATLAFQLDNSGSTPLTSATISYSVNGGGAQTYNWTGNLAVGASAFVLIPLTGTATGANTVVADVTLANGQPDQNPYNSTVEEQIAYYPGTNVARLYVRPGGSGNGSGTDWSNALAHLQDALSRASCGGVQEIWVAGGTYHPDRGGAQVPGDRAASFTLLPDVALYGGFAGTETDLSQRNLGATPTTLSGAINDVISGDNSFQVIRNVHGSGIPLPNTAILDGFTISDGHANSLFDQYRHGGGMWLQNANPTIRNCVFSNNQADIHGGAIHVQNATTVTFTNCTFSGNRTRYGSGGAALFQASTSTLINCVISGNLGGFAGGGLFISGAHQTLVNCTITGNRTVEHGGGIFIHTSTLLVQNSVVTSNRAATLSENDIYSSISDYQSTYTNVHSLFKSVTTADANGNLDGSLDPQFVQSVDYNAAPTTAGDLRLTGCSPALNAGDNTLNASTSDLAGNDRRYNNGTIDLGAYEFQGASEIRICYPDNDTDGYGDGNLPSQQVCGNCPPNFVDNGDDCNDTNGSINPAALEIPCNNIDENCDGSDSTFVGNILYVDINATGGNNNGQTWTDAFTDLQAGLDLAATCGIAQIWVAQGTYRPTGPNGDRTISFTLLPQTAIYGGFEGNETQLSERSWTDHPTILSGDLNGNDGSDFTGNAENSYHVVANIGNVLDETAILSGFTITGGNANGFHTNASVGAGGGVYNIGASPRFEHCRIVDNYASGSGGGFYSEGSSVRLHDCELSGNRAAVGSGGGARFSNIANAQTLTALLTNCNFSGNWANGSGGGFVFSGMPTTLNECRVIGNHSSFNGGGVYASTGSLTVRNGLFSGNYAAGNGGGFASFAASVSLTNCTVAGNRANDGGACHVNSIAALFMTNSIVCHNNGATGNTLGPVSAIMQYSMVEGHTVAGTSGNIDGSLDPLFVQQVDPLTAPTTGGDLQLTVGSPAYNVGDNNAVTGIPTDLLGGVRIQNGQVDLGPFESKVSLLPVEYLSFTGTPAETGNKLHWETALEENLDHYRIERSADGRSFEAIGEQPARNEPGSYEFLDTDPFSLSYYRLRSVELDGIEEFSRIITVQRAVSATPPILIYPNPTKGLLTLDAAPERLLRTRVFDATGRLVQQSTARRLDLSALPAGIYLLDILDETSGVRQRERVVRR